MTTKPTKSSIAPKPRILVIRNDKLGDFMLAWPAFALLKHYWPELHIIALVPEYTAPVAELCPFIDEVLLDPQDQNVFVLAKMVREAKFDAILTLFSTTRVALAGMLARTPYRLAPATKVAQIFYTDKLTQRRSRSEKPEYLYNIELAVQLLLDFKKVPPDFELDISSQDYLPAEIVRPLFLLNNEKDSVRKRFLQQNNLPAGSKMIFIHPGSGGSSVNLSVDQFVALANQIVYRAEQKVAVTICAGPGERENAESMQSQLSSAITSRIYHSTAGFKQFVKTLQIADLFISGSTGTLHVAGALDIPTVGFYPTKRSSTSLRWQTLNSPEHRLTFSLPEKGRDVPGDMFDIEKVARKVVENFAL